MNHVLSSEARAQALTLLASNTFDVVIVGGGVVGAGAALDAAARGLRVGLVEGRDWASGTSSRSSKLLHGGLRYLEMLDFRLVHEALIERGLLLTKLAPHLARPVSFLYPLTRGVWERPYVGSGIALYDAMARTSGNGAGLPLHRHLGKAGLKKVAAGLRDDVMHGAIRYYDAQIDDARHTMTLVRTAAAHGAVVANRAKVTAFTKSAGRVTGVSVVDAETGNEFSIDAKVVLNATGVWTDDMQALANTKGDFHVRMSKGVHLVVPGNRIDLDTGLILRTEQSVLFVIPWGKHWIVGTTDTDYTLDKQHPATSDADVQYLLDHVNAVLKKPLSRDDITGVYAGLRPLIRNNATSSAKTSREHLVARPVPGLVVVAGGKYTTYRVMAEDAIDEVGKALGGTMATSSTKDVPLLGAAGYHALLAAKEAKAEEWGLSVELVEHLLGRYGSLTPEVVALIMQDRSLGELLPGTDDYVRAEIIYAASHEGALHLEDVIARRTRMSFETFDRGTAAAPDVAALMGSVLGWTKAQQQAEVGAYQARVAAERNAQAAPDDVSAEAARLAVADIVPL